MTSAGDAQLLLAVDRRQPAPHLGDELGVGLALERQGGHDRRTGTWSARTRPMASDRQPERRPDAAQHAPARRAASGREHAAEAALVPVEVAGSSPSRSATASAAAGGTRKRVTRRWPAPPRAPLSTSSRRRSPRENRRPAWVWRSWARRSRRTPGSSRATTPPGARPGPARRRRPPATDGGVVQHRDAQGGVERTGRTKGRWARSATARSVDLRDAARR